jgi:hypothetical protein
MGKSYKKNFKDWYDDGNPKNKKKKVIKERIEEDTDIDPEDIDLDSFIKHYNSK